MSVVGLCGVGAVPHSEDEQGLIYRLVERHVWGEQQAGQRLFQLPQPVV